MSSNQPATGPKPELAQASVPPAQETATERTVVDIIDLPLGKELNETGATDFARDRQSRLIVLAGPVKGGKTTLLTSLYELFQWGPLAGQGFAWSITLPGFEQRCHQARTASDGPTAETQRTVYKGPDPYYLHLRTASVENPRLKTDFLFTDVSGEMFDHAINSESECKQLTFVKRAAHLVLLIDGAKVVREDRNAIVKKSKSILRSLLDCEMIPNFCYVSVVWAKWDYFTKLQPKDQKILKQFRESVEEDFQLSFGARIPDSRLQFTEVAARPKEDPQLSFGNGVAKLFDFWLNHSPQKRDLNLDMAVPDAGRESELFAMRHFSTLKH